MTYLVIWAAEFYGRQSVHFFKHDSEELALAMARALHNLQSHALYSVVRVFQTPDLRELDIG